MDRIIINKQFQKNSGHSIYGSVRIKNIELSAKSIEDALVDYILSDESLKYIFCDANPSKTQLRHFYERFIPQTNYCDAGFVKSEMKQHKSFYSFFAEGVLPVVYHDIWNYNLVFSAIDLNATLFGTKNGIDVCMYDKANNIFVMGEAKFYIDFKLGINKIIDDFTKESSLFSKIVSLFQYVRMNENLTSIVIKQISKNNYSEMCIDDFLKQKIDFCGFVLHELGTYKENDFEKEEVYSKFNINNFDIYCCLKNKYKDVNLDNITIKIFHLFIESKEALILKAIDKAREHVKKLQQL